MDIRVKPTAALADGALIPAARGEHLATVMFGLWMTIGLFLDGYFHQNLDTDGESFLTPWHAVFYSGFMASALWLDRMGRRRGGGVVFSWRLSTLPPGYRGAGVGLALFGLGGLADAVWHSAFGVERGIDALLSPTHLLLFSGLFLILTSPVRAAYARPAAPPGRWMVAVSVVTTTALVGFFVNFAWGLGISALARVAYDPVTGVGESSVIAGVASTLVTTAVLFSAARLLLAAGPVPTGALVVLFGTVALLVSAAFDEDAEGVAAAVVGGLVLELVLRVPRVARGRERWQTPACFAVAAATLWLTYMGLLSVGDGVDWQAEIWSGTAALNALAAMAFGLGAPPPQRARAAITKGAST